MILRPAKMRKTEFFTVPFTQSRISQTYKEKDLVFNGLAISAVNNKMNSQAMDPLRYLVLLDNRCSINERTFVIRDQICFSSFHSHTLSSFSIQHSVFTSINGFRHEKSTVIQSPKQAIICLEFGRILCCFYAFAIRPFAIQNANIILL